MSRAARFALLALASLGAASLASAAEFVAAGADGKPLADVAVWAVPADGKALPKREAKTPEIGQKGRMFESLVTVVEVGGKVAFPNRDTVRHHVYSFSKAKTFDVKLYAGGEAPQVVFDQPGLVVVGCNIHDQMVAYVRVVPSSMFAVTDAAGKAKIDLPAGEWAVMAWHPSMGESLPEVKTAFKGGLEPVRLSIPAAK